MIKIRSHRSLLVAITVLIAILAAVAVTAGSPAPDRTFAKIAVPVQSLISVIVPFFGALAATDLRRGRLGITTSQMFLSSWATAIALALFGSAVCAVALAPVSTDAAPDRWQGLGSAVIGGMIVQVVAQLVGTGLGLLIPRYVIAVVGTIVLPLGLWLILGAVEVLQPAQPWLTPYASVPDLLSGRLTWLLAAHVGSVVVIWGVVLNGIGLYRLKQRRLSAD